jgi:hypothetical protein
MEVEHGERGPLLVDGDLVVVGLNCRREGLPRDVDDLEPAGL